MSKYTQYFSDIKKSAGKAPEKSNFAQTCNLLSRYLKKKGSLKDLNLGINGRLEAIGRPEKSPATRTTTTMDFLNSMEYPGQTSTPQEKSMNVFPQYVSVDSFSSDLGNGTNEASYSKAATIESKTAQMTIFYAGQVLVFGDFPADRAREVMLLANNGSGGGGGVVSTSFAVPKIDHGASYAPASNSPSNSGSNTAQEPLLPQFQATGSDLPIARRSSLHKFLEKKKERAIARAPYQLHNHPSTSSPKHEQKFDLNL